jgi:hypothetical protein
MSSSPTRETLRTLVELDRERAHVRRIRNLIAAGAALTGIFPFFAAVAPRVAAHAVARTGLAAWVALTLGTLGTAFEDLLLARDQRRLRKQLQAGDEHEPS